MEAADEETESGQLMFLKGRLVQIYQCHLWISVPSGLFVNITPETKEQVVWRAQTQCHIKVTRGQPSVTNEYPPNSMKRCQWQNVADLA
ncbi:hypothetical protein STEG23_012023 [Scotinomys teguina]